MHTIVMFPKIQVDTAIAYFLLTTFGEQAFPGISEAPVEFWTEMPSDITVEELESRGHILIDLGMSKFDHHRFGPENNKITSSYLIAEHLGILDRADIQKLLELARRDDLEGKGTISSDPIDRAFGISALLTNLNKSMPGNSKAVLDLVTPLISGHFLEENRRHEQLPREHKELTQAGKIIEFNAVQLGRNLKIVYAESDNPALAGYLRSRAVGAGVVLQRASTGHLNVIANQNANIRLHKLARLIKLLEADKNQIVLEIDDIYDLEKAGRTEGLPHWYYDTRANTIQNGGVNPQGIPATLLTVEEITELVKDGLNIEREQRRDNRDFRPNRNSSNRNHSNRHNSGQGKFTKGKGVVYLD